MVGRDSSPSFHTSADLSDSDLFAHLSPNQSGRLTASRISRAVIFAVLFGYSLNTLLSVIAAGIQGPPLFGLVLCLAAAFVLQIAHSTRDPLTWAPQVRAATLSTQAVVTFLPFLWVGPQAGALAGFLAGSALLALPHRWRWWVAAGVVLGVLVLLRAEGLAGVHIAYGVYFSALTGLVVYGISSLVALVATVHSARGELAWMAVAQERLRVARDLHDLLGFNVSAAMLKSELAYRLLPIATDRAQRELRDVLQISHRALVDVRMVAGEGRRMSLAAEVEAARGLLTAAEVQVEVEVTVPELPEEIDTVLAIVLREATTNTLRHSKAQQCQIRSSVVAGQVRLLIENDGVDPEGQAHAPSGSGLNNLTERLEPLGGRLVSTVEGGRFRLFVTVPAPSVPAGHATGKADVTPVVPPAAGSEASRWHRRVARTITALVFSGYALLMVINILPGQPGLPGLIGFAACVATLVGVQILYSLRRTWTWPRHLLAASLAGQAVVTALPLLWIGAPWGSMGGFLAGSMLLVTREALRWPLYGSVGGAILIVSLFYGHDPGWTAYLTLSTLLTGIAVYGIGSLSGLVQQVDQARTELAHVAVTRERLRVAGEVQDQFGQLLSAMTAKCETAIRFLPGQPELAKAELAEVLDIARRAVANIRTVASGYRHLSFHTEVDSATTSLAAAGIRTTVKAPEILPAEVEALLAIALREAVTNMIRHSEARRCDIEVRLTGEAVRLRVANDGVSPGGLRRTRFAGLADRLRAIGGSLSIEMTDGTFILWVEVPVTATIGNRPPSS